MTGTAHTDPFAASRALLAGTGLDHDHVLSVVRTALAEDLAFGPDVTTEATIPVTARGTAHVVAHADGTIAGLAVAAAAIEVLAEQAADQDPPAITFTALLSDGDRVQSGGRVLTITGPTRLILTAERTLLNFLCQLSGVATETARWVQAVGSELDTDGRPRVAVRDTRKTVPGLRSLQKYAVTCGGGFNYRIALGDAALIKDNHIAAAGSLTEALDAVRRHSPSVAVEVECDTLEQVAEALTAGAELILLDNMSVEQIAAAVTLAQPHDAKLEASGGITLANVHAIAATGVDYFAIGALTHSAPVLDLGLDLEAAVDIDDGRESVGNDLEEST